MPGKLDKIRPPAVPNTGLEERNKAEEVLNTKMEDVHPDEVPEEGAKDKDAEAIEDYVVKCLEDLLVEIRDEDKSIRDEQIRLWRKLDYYWNNILDIFYDEVARDWRIPTDEEWEEIEEEKPRAINIFRPHGEAIVAALSVTIPALMFYPDDSDNPDDLEAAQAYRNITELLSRHNDGPMLFIRALVIRLCQGTVFGYNYYREDTKYGTLDKPQVQFKDVNFFDVFCPNCGEPLDAMMGAAPTDSYTCPECGYVSTGEVIQKTESMPQIIGFDKTPKGSIKQEVFSGLQVKIPMYAKIQEECGFLLLEFQQSVAMLRGIFSERAKDIDNATYDQYLAHLPSHYRNTLPDNTAKVSALWLRPWEFWRLYNDSPEKVEEVNKLHQLYPNGCYALFINDKLFDIVDENLDDHWTISKNPLGSSLIARPLAENLATVQDIRAELVELELQTVEHGIPEVFVENGVLDIEKYGKQRSKPGMVTVVKPKSGKTLEQSFHMSKPAILSQEVDPIRQHIDQDAQFVLGSFPSVYGGPAQGGSKTAAEYAQSKSMALQRLNTEWKIDCEFWADFQSRSAREYAQVLREESRDERFVSKEGASFVNKWILFTTLNGKVGRVEPEASDQLPASWQQKKDVVFQMLTSGLPEFMQILAHPRNFELIKSATGLQELYIPGEDARNRQYREYTLMTQGIQVPVNPNDNHMIHAEILRTLLESAMADTLGPEERMICEQHLNEHQMFIQMAQQQAAATQDSAPGNESKEKANANQ